MKLLALRAVKGIAVFTMDRVVRRGDACRISEIGRWPSSSLTFWTSGWRRWLPWIWLEGDMRCQFGPALRGPGVVVRLEPTWFQGSS